MTVKQYVEIRPIAIYGKKIRVIEKLPDGFQRSGMWYEYQTRIIKDVKITSKWIFIFLENERFCEKCIYAEKGKCAKTEECHSCMWENNYKPRR